MPRSRFARAATVSRHGLGGCALLLRKDSFMLTRRQLLRSAAAAAVLAPLGVRLSTAASAASGPPAAFTTPLRIPRVLVPRRAADGDHYELTARAATADVWPGSA